LCVVSKYSNFFPKFSTSDFSSDVSVVNLLSTSAIGLKTNLPIVSECYNLVTRLGMNVESEEISRPAYILPTPS
jgi:hypothetical protein